MLRRRRPLLRAAAVGGGAYIAGKHMANKANEQADYQAQQDQRISDLEAQQQGPPDQQYQQAPPQQYQQAPPQYQQAPPPPAAPPAAPSMYDQLSQLATLHDQGALTDDEFTAAKAKLLGT
jgi:Short C-terminal domain